MCWYYYIDIVKSFPVQVMPAKILISNKRQKKKDSPELSSQLKTRETHPKQIGKMIKIELVLILVLENKNLILRFEAKVP